jgi:hypothetical protein
MSTLMQYRRFGRTELAMPVFSCGSMRYQFRWQDLPERDIPKANQENLERTVARALELGINHIETARGYGSSERQLGRALQALNRDGLIVQTKIEPNADPKLFEQEFHDSLARLRLDHVDLLAIHGINNQQRVDWTLRDGGCFAVAQRLREQGKARFVGFSTHAPLEQILQCVRFGEPRTGQGFDYVNLHFYYVMQRNWAAIAEARARDMGVFIISPTDKGGRLYAPPEKLVRLCAPLSPIVFNDLFCLSHPEIATLSIGAARPSDFDEHMKTLALLERAREECEPIDQRLREAMRLATGYADPEHFLPGMPEFDRLPKRYNLATILWLLNLAEGWDLVEFGRWRFGMLDNADHWFAGNRPRSLSEIDDAALLDALGGYPEKEAIVKRLRRAVELLSGQDNRRLSQGG